LQETAAISINVNPSPFRGNCGTAVLGKPKTDLAGRRID
jgi:hypothetical protein